MGFLRHDKMVDPHAAYLTASLYMSITECCAFGSLKHFIDQRRDDNQRIPEEVVYMVLIDLLEAVSYLHQRHWLHADIRPANIFVSGEGYVKLGKVGAAR